MNLQTTVELPPYPNKISYSTPCLLIGSCFSDYIGSIMQNYLFPVLLNPFGTLFNPASIAANLDNLIGRKVFGMDDLKFHDGQWLSFDHYTGFSDSDREKCLSGINESSAQASEWLKKADFLILTFGTAWVYRYRQTGKIVANCHKIPQHEFSKEILKPDEIIKMYERVLARLIEYNSRLKIIFTLSPVRHWADGAVNNQLSKSVLHLSIQEIIKGRESASYFPSYEIFMDELRDYRFYAPDMLHPSKQGTDYIWEKFSGSILDEAAVSIMKKVEPVIKALRHRPVNPDSETFSKFRESILKKINDLQKQYPFLDFSKMSPAGVDLP